MCLHKRSQLLIYTLVVSVLLLRTLQTHLFLVKRAVSFCLSMDLNRPQRFIFQPVS